MAKLVRTIAAAHFILMFLLLGIFENGKREMGGEGLLVGIGICDSVHLAAIL